MIFRKVVMRLFLLFVFLSHSALADKMTRICSDPFNNVMKILAQLSENSQGEQCTKDSYFAVLPQEVQSIVNRYWDGTPSLLEVLENRGVFSSFQRIQQLDLSREKFCGLELSREQLLLLLDAVHKVFPNLTGINLTGHDQSKIDNVNNSDPIVDKLYQLYPHLEKLCMGSNYKVWDRSSDSILLKIADLFPKLRYLCYPGSYTSATMEQLAKKQPQFEFLENFNFHDAGFPVSTQQIRKFHHLSKITLRRPFDDVNLLVETHPHLEEVAMPLPYTFDYVSNIQKLAQLKDLKALETRTRFKGNSIIPLVASSFPKLESLAVNDLNQDEVTVLASMGPHLKKISVETSQNAAIDFSKFPNLEELNLGFFNPSSADSLAQNCPRLKKLQVYGGMTPDQLDKILKAHPDLRVLIYPIGPHSNRINASNLKTIKENLSKLEYLDINFGQDKPERDLIVGLDELSSDVMIFTTSDYTKPRKKKVQLLQRRRPPELMHSIL